MVKGNLRNQSLWGSAVVCPGRADQASPKANSTSAPLVGNFMTLYSLDHN